MHGGNSLPTLGHVACKKHQLFTAIAHRNEKIYSLFIKLEGAVAMSTRDTNEGLLWGMSKEGVMLLLHG